MNGHVWKGAGRRVYLQEVGTRDGLQAESQFVPTGDKIALVNALADAGLIGEPQPISISSRQRAMIGLKSSAPAS